MPGTDLIPLFDTLLSTIKPPEGDPEAPFQMLVSSVDYNEFVGRIGIGRIQNALPRWVRKWSCATGTTPT